MVTGLHQEANIDRLDALNHPRLPRIPDSLKL
jgi:hypothetical protein